MERVHKLFPEGRKKVFTLSYDDGIGQDRRLVDILNQYGIKATFNLNSGLMNGKSGWTGLNGLEIKHIDRKEIAELYKGHEVAVHSLNHPFLQKLEEEEIFHELEEDKKNLEALVGYTVSGMAYPYGTYNDTVKAVAKKVGIKYSRTVQQHFSFVFPEDYLEWHATCHHSFPGLMELAAGFANSESRTPELFYVWGHSYEFDEQENWDMFEQFCRYMGNREDIWYATNIQIYDHMHSL